MDGYIAEKPITARIFGTIEIYKREAPGGAGNTPRADMEGQAPMFHDDTPSDIPVGYCQCGCGRKTSIAAKTSAARGDIKGKPRRFLPGHYIRPQATTDARQIRVRSDGSIGIPLSSRKYPGLYAVVDEGDKDLVSRYQWRPNRRHGNVYAMARIKDGTGVARQVFMHRLILGFGPGDPEIDHANHNGLDNRRANIRPCTRMQNQANRKRLPATKSSRYRGVVWHKRQKIWQASISVNGKRAFLGMFRNEQDAARAYDKAALEAWKEFAMLNFPTDNDE